MFSRERDSVSEPALVEGARVQQHERTAARTVDGCAIIVVIDTQELLELDEVGTYIWEQIAEPQALSQLAERVSTEFDVSAETARIDLEGFLASLTQIGAARVLDA